MRFLLSKKLVGKIKGAMTRFGGMMILRDELRKVGFTLDVTICRSIVNAVMSDQAEPSGNFASEFIVIL